MEPCPLPICPLGDACRGEEGKGEFLLLPWRLEALLDCLLLFFLSEGPPWPRLWACFPEYCPSPRSLLEE